MYRRRRRRRRRRKWSESSPLPCNRYRRAGPSGSVQGCIADYYVQQRSIRRFFIPISLFRLFCFPWQPVIGPQPDPRVRRGIYDASEARAARLKRVSAILRSTEPLSLSLSLFLVFVIACRSSCGLNGLAPAAQWMWVAAGLSVAIQWDLNTRRNGRHCENKQQQQLYSIYSIV